MAVMKNGREAVNRGFRVVVREIPLDNGQTKNDPDSFITSASILSSLEEQDFCAVVCGESLSRPHDTFRTHRGYKGGMRHARGHRGRDSRLYVPRTAH